MLSTNAFTTLTKTQYPIIQAPMAGGATTSALIATVANRGLLGSLGAAYLSPQELRTMIREIRQQTDKAFAVNLFAPTTLQANAISQDKICIILNKICQELAIDIKAVQAPYKPNFDEQLAVLLDEKISIFSFVFGLPQLHSIAQLKANQVILIGTATNLDEAQQLASAGVDAIVAQGIEAGGHRGTFNPQATDLELSTIDLVKLLSENITLPIIAAGGITCAQDINTAFLAGAQACQLGTAFLTTHESGAHPLHKQALLSATKDKTTLTRAFSGRLARGLQNYFIDAMQKFEHDILPFPIQNKLTKQVRQASAMQNNTEFMSLWAGSSVHQCRDISANKLIDLLIDHFK